MQLFPCASSSVLLLCLLPLCLLPCPPPFVPLLYLVCSSTPPRPPPFWPRPMASARGGWRSAWHCVAAVVGVAVEFELAVPMRVWARRPCRQKTRGRVEAGGPAAPGSGSGRVGCICNENQKAAAQWQLQFGVNACCSVVLVWRSRQPIAVGHIS